MVYRDDTILFVDDEQNILDGYAAGLRRRFQVETALGGKKALEMVRDRGPYSVIVSDLKMPGMDGMTFLGKVRKLSPDTVCVMLTGHADMESSIRAVNEGIIFRFLTKPCPMEDIAKALEAATRQYSLGVAEKKLKKAQQFAHELLQGVPAGVVVIDAETHTIVEINERAAKLVGVERQKALGESCHKLICPAEKGKCPVTDLGKSVDNADRVLPNGLTVMKNVVTFYNEGKQYLLETFVDISLRVQLEERLKRALEEVGQSNKAKMEFISRMSHELRTPLNSIIGFSGQLLESKAHPLPPDQAAQAEHIQIAGRHLLDMVNDILDFSKIEAGGMSISLESVPPREVVAECVSLLQQLSGKMHVSVDVENGLERLPMLRVDRTRFKQIMLNLLSNAIKYNKVGGTVRLSGHSLKNSVVLTVQDTGIGIPKDRQEELFEPFTRFVGDSSEVEGTGIGLSITKQLVETMGGEISFFSVPGEGTMFTLSLPRSGEEESPRAVETDGSRVKAETAGLPPTGGPEALAADLLAALEGLKASLAASDPIRCREDAAAIQSLNWPVSLSSLAIDLAACVTLYEFGKATALVHEMESRLDTTEATNE